MAPADGGRATEDARAAQSQVRAGREWTERLAGEHLSERRLSRDAQAMLTEAEGCGVVINEIVAIRRLGRARVWQEARRKLQASSTRRLSKATR